MKTTKEIKEKVADTIGDKAINEKVDESRDMLLNYQDRMNPKDEVTKKEIKNLMKDDKKKKDERGIRQFFTSLLKRFELRKFRKRNKRLLTHGTKKDNRIIREAEYRKEIKEIKESNTKYRSKL